jgi:hypothetical protein
MLQVQGRTVLHVRQHARGAPEAGIETATGSA